ncbi:hypothetical protein BDV3_005082 [Batrachochytrium dendrobatidis]
MDPRTLHQETLFLVARFLAGAGFQNTSAALEQEINQRQLSEPACVAQSESCPNASQTASAQVLSIASALLPPAIDTNGNQHIQTYSQMTSRYAHTSSNELMHMVQLALNHVESLLPFPASICSSIGATYLLQLASSTTPSNAATNNTNTAVCQSSNSPVSSHIISTTKQFSQKYNLAAALARFELGARYLKRHFPSKFVGSRIGKSITFRGHLAPVYSVIFDRTGTRLVTGGDDSLVKVWSIESGWLMETLRGHQTYLPTNERVVIIDIAIDYYNKHLATAANDQYIRLWNFDSLTPKQSLHVGKEITTITFSPSPEEDNQCLLVTCADSKSRVYMWDPTTKFFCRNPIIIQGGTIARDQVTSSSFNKTGTKFATGGSDGIVYLYSILSRSLMDVGGGSDTNTNVYASQARQASVVQPKLIKMFDCHKSRVADVIFSNRGDRILSGSKDGSVVINQFCPKTATWTSLSFAPILVYLVGSEPTTNPPDPAPAVASTIQVDHASTPAGLFESSLGDPGVDVPLDTRIDNAASTDRPRNRSELHALEAYYLCWNADDSCIMVSYAESRNEAIYVNSRIQVYDSVRGDCIHSLRTHKDLVIALSPHPTDNRMLLSTGHDGIVVFWDIFRGIPIYSTKFTDALLDSKFSPDGTHVAFVDVTGAAHLYAFGVSKNKFTGVPEFQFFNKDWKIVKQADQHGGLVDEEAQLPAHLVVQGVLMDQSASVHPSSIQSKRQSWLAWLESRTKSVAQGISQPFEELSTLTKLHLFDDMPCVEADLVHRKALLEEERQWIIFEQRFTTQLLDVKLLKKRRNQIVESDNEGDDLIQDITTGSHVNGADVLGTFGDSGSISGRVLNGSATNGNMFPLQDPIVPLPVSSGDEYDGSQDEVEEDSESDDDDGAVAFENGDERGDPSSVMSTFSASTASNSNHRHPRARSQHLFQIEDDEDGAPGPSQSPFRMRTTTWRHTSTSRKSDRRKTQHGTNGHNSNGSGRPRANVSYVNDDTTDEMDTSEDSLDESDQSPVRARTSRGTTFRQPATSTNKSKSKSKTGSQRHTVQHKQRSGLSNTGQSKETISSYSRIVASPWVSTYHQAWSPYLPQIGDIVAYIQTGHRHFLTKSAALSKTTGIRFPNTPIDETLSFVSFGKISVLEFEPGFIKKTRSVAAAENDSSLEKSDIPVICLVTLDLFSPRDCNSPISTLQDLVPMTQATAGRNTEKSQRKKLKIAFCDLDDLPDFLVLFDNYVAGSRCRGYGLSGSNSELSMTESAWDVGDHAIVRYGDVDYAGIIHSIADETDDPWSKYTVQFSGTVVDGVSGASGDGESGVDTFSAWEIRPEHTTWPFTETLPEYETSRIMAIIEDVCTKEEMALFVDPVPYDAFPTYLLFVGYPMWLNLIKARLENNFYRRTESVVWDIERIHINASRFNEPDSAIAVLAVTCLTKIADAINDTNCTQLEWKVSEWMGELHQCTSDDCTSSTVNTNENSEPQIDDDSETNESRHSQSYQSSSNFEDEDMPVAPEGRSKKSRLFSKQQSSKQGRASKPAAFPSRTSKRKRMQISSSDDDVFCPRKSDSEEFESESMVESDQSESNQSVDEYDNMSRVTKSQRSKRRR